jgi:hypothetical protein
MNMRRLQKSSTFRPNLYYSSTRHKLAKAAILANNTSMELKDLSYHGLSTRPSTVPAPQDSVLRGYAGDNSQWKVEAEFAVTNEGIFPVLCNLTGDHLIGTRAVLRFQELVRMLPDLAQLYARHYGERSLCFPIYSGPKINEQSKFEIYFNSGTDLDEVVSTFAEFNSGYQRPEPLHGIAPGFCSEGSTTVVPEFINLQKATAAGRYLVRPHVSGIRGPTATIYAGLFILSNVVRYKPAFWMRVLEGEVAGSAAIVEAFCNLAKRRFPNDILGLIWSEDFTYGTAAYLG